MKAIICGGGTLGHVTPGISIAETILERDRNSKILFIGREGGEENKIIQNHGYRLETVKISGISRSLSLSNIETVRNIFKALKKSKEILLDFSPDIVIGTGGYVCWPVIKSAQRLKIPNIIHESNVCPGLSTRLLASKCNRVLLNFPGSEVAFKNKENLRIVGNPIRRSLLNESKDSARKKLGIKKSDFFIFSFGGSGGSQKLNECIISLMKNYSSRFSHIKHVHACGKRYFEQTKKEHPELCEERNGCVIYPFIENISAYIAGADVIICRCGAMTLSEISRAGTVPILIPSPNVTDNHQYKNGKLFTDKGAAIMIEESELNYRTLVDAVKYLESNPEIKRKMSSKVSAFHRNDTRELIYQEISFFLQ